MKNNGLGQTGT